MEQSGKHEAASGVSPAVAKAGQDLRGAERLTLMLRVAKLVSEQRELPCIIRDVSTTGVRLRLFHSLEAETRLAIELANGDFYFIEKVWERGDEAGFRFAAEIDVAAFIAETSAHPRRPVRLRTHIPAILLSRGSTHSAVLTDLSQTGARIETAGPLEFDQRLRIDAPGLPEIEARVRWLAHPEYGVVFERSFRLDDLARMIAALSAQADDDGAFSIPGLAARMAQFG
jgi:hypothetical protein